MKRIFRSILDVKKEGKSTIEQDELIRNYRSFLTSKVQPEDTSFIKMYTWIEAHYREYKEVPSIELIHERARKEGDEGVLASLMEIVQETPYIRSNYKEILKEKFNQQSKDGLQTLMTKTWQAVNSGLQISKNKTIQGMSSAIEYFISESRKFRFSNLNTKTESNVRNKEDSEEVRNDYEKRKRDPSASLGMYPYLDKIDEATRGLKPGELLIIAAFVGQGKTIFSTNLAYNGIKQGMNGLFVALEMPFNEMRDMIYVLHSANPDWEDNPKYRNMRGKISYEKVCYGELSDMEQEFFNLSSKDLVERTDFGELIIHQPTDPLTPSKLEMLVYDYDARLKDQGKKLDFVLVDYVGLMVPDKNERYGDWNIDLNNIIKRMKNFAINFDNGRGLRLITPFQVNRQGHKDAEKNDGVYKLAALSNANEAERSADLVLSLFMSDDMRASGNIKICCLKHRKGKVFQPFEAHIDFVSRQIRDFIQKKDNKSVEDQIQNIPMDE